jgi:hypothetical protein
MRRPAALTACTGVIALLTGCAAVGSAWEYLTTERPPYALRAIELTSDARIDTSGVMVGTFLGSGTDERVTLISSDTGFIAALAREYLPDRGRDLWSTLARNGTTVLAAERMRRFVHRAEVGDARVASTHGHSFVSLGLVKLRGSSCGWRGARAEITVSGPLRGSRAPSVRGPVVGSFRPGESSDARAWRDAIPGPAPALARDLVERTERDLDSVLAFRRPRGLGGLDPVSAHPLLLDPLADVNAAEVVPLWAGQGRVRYAVAIRALRITARDDTALVSTVMIWDSAGTWRQTVLAPTVVEMWGGRMRPTQDPAFPPVFWRRLDAIAGFGLDRDYLFVEQVDVGQGSVYWGAIEARSNNVVAAAEVGGACVDDDDRDHRRGRDR